jgi:hypothetical protein
VEDLYKHAKITKAGISLQDPHMKTPYQSVTSTLTKCMNNTYHKTYQHQGSMHEYLQTRIHINRQS